MKKETPLFTIGTIVTLKSHPLLNNLRIKGDGKLIPPFMVVTEVFIENKNKKTHCEELGKKIADRIKYTCVFFDDNRTEFKEVILYESMLEDYSKVYIAKKGGKVIDKSDNYVSLIDEAKNYKLPNYVYGNVLLFKTKKFEIFKKRDSVKTQNIESDKEKKEKNITEKTKKVSKTEQYIVNYATPDFVLCGTKKNENKTEFYSNGELKRDTSDVLFKVKWFNSNQMKFSDVYLPGECFVDIQLLK